MHRRLLPRVLAGLVLVGSLAACDLGGATPGALISAAPSPVILHLPLDGDLGFDEAIITVRNLGPATTAALDVTATFENDQQNQFAFALGDLACDGATLDQNETCQVQVAVKGYQPTHPYEITVHVSGANTNTVSVPVFIL